MIKERLNKKPMAAISTRCKCGCESIINSDVPKQFINNRICFKCNEPLKFRVKDELQEAILSEEPIKIETKVSKQRKNIKSKGKKGAKR